MPRRPPPPPPPPEPWELDYPWRDDLWAIEVACGVVADARRARAAQAEPAPSAAIPPSPTVADVVTAEAASGAASTVVEEPGRSVADDEAASIERAQVSAAYRIERLAREFLGGMQFTGVQIRKRGVLVDAASTARTIARAWRATPRSAGAQAAIDRAVGCLRQCFDAGMVVLEWDRPGYDDVTRDFRALLAFASDPSVTPLVLAFDPTYHGSRHDRIDPAEVFDEEELRAFARVRARRRLLDLVEKLPFAMMIALLLWIPWRIGLFHRSPPPLEVPPPRPCSEEMAMLRVEIPIAPVRAGETDEPELRREALARLDAGDVDAAAARLAESHVAQLAAIGRDLRAWRVRCGPPTPR